KGNGKGTVLVRSWNSSSSEGVITLSNVNNCKIENLQIYGSKTSSHNHGIFLSNCGYSIITGNYCILNNYGIYLSNSSHNIITGNICNENNSGIYLFFSSHRNTITDNVCNVNSYGIYLSSGNNNTI